MCNFTANAICTIQRCFNCELYKLLHSKHLKFKFLSCLSSLLYPRSEVQNSGTLDADAMASQPRDHFENPETSPARY